MPAAADLCTISCYVNSYIRDSSLMAGYIFTRYSSHDSSRSFNDCCIPSIGPEVGQIVLLESICLDVLFNAHQRGSGG